MWFSGVVALWLRRRRFAGNKRTARRRGIGLSLLLGLIVLWSARGARADGPIVGVDTGWSEPTSGNYRANVQSGFAVNPYVGYMFNEYLGLQGQMHIVYQGSDYHNDRNIPNEGQATTLLGWTAGPRFAYTLFDRFDCYATAQGGVFTGVSGRVAHTGAGFSAGPGINYNITPALGVGVFARYNYAYVHTSPEDVGAGQVPQERFASNIEWMTLGVGMRYSFLHEEAPPPPPPPPPPEPGAAPVKKRLILRAVYFDFDKSNIRPDAAPVLDEAVELLKQEGPVKVVAEGHTDAIGTVPYNLKLSERRASSVRQYLVDHGLNGKNIDTKGFGKSQPVATNDTAEGRAQNRRVELRVLQ